MHARTSDELTSMHARTADSLTAESLRRACGVAFENVFTPHDPMRRAPVLPLTRALPSRVAALVASVVCVACAALGLPLAIISSLCGGQR
jgi:hypothetical protein